MCSGKGGTSSQQQQSTTTIPPEIMARYGDLYGRARDVSNIPYQNYPGEFVSPFNERQTGAANWITGTQPVNDSYALEASGMLRSGLAGGNQLLGQAGSMIPGASTPGALDINKYLQPGFENVIDPVRQLIQQQQGQQQNDLRSQEIMAGAFGGDRSSIAKDVLSGQQNLAMGNVLSPLYQQNYAQALQAAQQQQGVNLAAKQWGEGATAGLAGQTFGQGLQGAQGTAGLGANYVNNRLGIGQATLGAGTLEQQTSQAGLSALYNQWLQQQAYPFQTTQFLANVMSGVPFGQSTSMSGSAFQPQPFFSDDKLKENIKTIGHTKDGLKIIRYNHKDDPGKVLRIGFLASDVEKKMPEAVSHHAGLRAVDYDRAARAAGGLVGPSDMREGYAGGGDPMSAMLQAHQAMYPGVLGRPGIGDTGPRGMQLHPARAPRAVQPAGLTMATPKQPEPELKAAVKDVNDIAGIGKAGKDIYSLGKDAYSGAKDIYDWATKPSSTSGGVAAPGTSGTPGSITSSSLAAPTGDTSANLAAPVPVDTSSLAGLSPDLFANTGGRMQRAAGGGFGAIPYTDLGGHGYVPEPEDPLEKIARQQKQQIQQSGMSGQGGGGGSTVGNLASLASLGKMGAEGLSALGVFGSAAPLAGASEGVGLANLAELGFLLKRGGRAGFQEGGVPDADSVPLIDDDRRRAAELDRKPSFLPVPQRAGVAVEEPGGGSSIPPTVSRETPREPVPLPPKSGVAYEGPPPPAPDFGEKPGHYVDTRPAGVATTAPAPAASVAPAAGTEDPMWPRMVTQESGGRHFDPKTGEPLTSSAGARGVAQIMPGTGPEAARLAGVPWNPELFNRGRTGDPVKDKEAEDYNRTLGKAYYEEQKKSFNDPNMAAAAYNAGPEAVKRAMQIAAVKGNQWWQNLPAETQGYLWNVTGHQMGSPSAGGGGGSTAVALNAPAQLGATAAGPAAGVAAPKDFMDRAGDWFDRNEKYLVPALSFLGNMLASPSRTLAGAVGGGLVGAAQALPMQQRIGQEQQRIDITQRSQLLSLYNQLLVRRAGLVGQKGASDPSVAAIDAQLANLEKMIGAGALSGATVGGGPGGGGVAPAPGSPNLPAGGVSPAPALAPQPGAGSIPVVPPATALPPPVTNPPATPGPTPAVTDQDPPSMRQPNTDFPPDFLAKLEPLQNPVELRRRAAEMAGVDDARAEKYKQDAARIQKEMLDTGFAQDRNGNMIPVPNANAIKQSQAWVANNSQWQASQEPVFQQRKIMRNQIEHIAKAVEKLEPGEFAGTKADIQASIAGALGMRPPSTATMNADEFQTFMKNARNVIVGSPTNDAKTDAARQILAEGFADPHLQPKAVRRILAQSLGNLEAADDFYRDMSEKLVRAPHLNRNKRAEEFDKEPNHKLEDYYQKYEKDLAVRGDLPDEITSKDIDRAYIMTPQDMLQLAPKGSNVTLDKIRQEFFDGGNQARRFRIKDVNGRLKPVPE